MATDWQIIFDTNNDAILVLDQDMRIQRANKKSEQLFHRPSRELIGKHCWEIAHGTEQAIPECPNMQAKQGLCRQTLELPIGESWYQIKVDPILDTRGRYAGAVHIFADINERKQAEMALSQKTALLDNILGNVRKTAIVTTDLDFRINYFNPMAEELFGYTMEDAIGKTVQEMHTKEKNKLHASRMESIGTLTGGIAHDFNNLLSAIIGNIQLAENEIKPDVGTSKFLKNALEASRQAKELTTQLITFSKGGAPIKKVGSIGGLIKETTGLVLAGTGVKCELLLPHELWPVEFDEDQMKHAVKNLIVNAVEFMPDGGTIILKAENAIVTAKQDLPNTKGRYIKLSIQDQGRGISEKHLSMVFDPYFSTKEMGAQKGMGLSLATTYSIINRHDGHITVESEIDVGTTFTLYLPAYEKAVRALKQEVISKPEKRAKRTGRILLMDDEEMIRNLGEEVLSRFGYDVEVAQNGAEAIELYKKALDSSKPFEMVILDLTVKGGMGGKEVVKKILEIDPHAKAIVSSGYSNDPVITNYRGYGFTGALPKPYTLKNLSDELNKVSKLA